MNFDFSSISTLWWLFIILIINSFIALAYALIACWSIGVRAWLYGLIIFFCPIVGPVMLFISYLIRRLFLTGKDVDLSAASFVQEKKMFIFAPSADEADLVPIEESLLVAPIQERRRAFLNSIRLNVNKDASLYTLGLDNDDSETSHYSASVVMEANSSFLEDLQSLGVAYARDPDDTEIAFAYADEAKEYLDSGIPRGIEVARYQNLYTSVMDGIHAKHPEQLTQEHYAQTVTYLLARSEFPRAISWAKEGVSRFPDTESAHLTIIKVYYTMGDSEEMQRALDNMNNGYAPLSRDGVDLIRFFTGHSGDTVPNGSVPQLPTEKPSSGVETA
jgi:hypothetical protein